MKSNKLPLKLNLNTSYHRIIINVNLKVATISSLLGTTFAIFLCPFAYGGNMTVVSLASTCHIFA